MTIKQKETQDRSWTLPRWVFSVRTKFAALTSLMLLLIAVFIYWYVPRQLEAKSLAAIAGRARSISAMTAYNVSLAVLNDDRPTVCAAVISAKRNEGLDYVMVQDASGNVIATYDSVRALALKYEEADFADRVSADGMTYQTALPIIVHNEVVGRVYVGLSLQPLHEEVRQSRSTIAVVSGGILLLGSLITIALSALITRPLVRMTATATRLAAGGDWTERVRITSRDEIGRMGVAFNTMMDALAHAYDQLHRSERQYRDVVENATDLIVSFADDGALEFVNRSFMHTLGYTADEIAFLRIEHIVADRSLEAFNAAVHDASRGKQVTCLQSIFVARDGREVIVEGSLTCSMEREFTRSVRGIFRDVTERHRAAEIAQLEKARFEQLFENAPIGIILVNPDRRIVRANREFSRVFGFSSEELYGRSIHETIVPWDLKDEGDKLFGRVLQGSAAMKETVRRTKDGRLIHVQIYGVPILMDGQTIGVFGMYVDITQQKNAAEAVRLEKARFEQLFKNAPIGILLADSRERILQANNAFQQMFGYSLEELRGHTINETIVPTHLRHEGNELSHRVLKGEPVMTESVRITKQGTPLDVNIYGVPILINDRAVGVFGMYVDVTERKRAEEHRLELLRHLEATNKELNDFAYIVSHDLKAPLRAIGSLASWLASDHAEKLGDEGKELVQLLLARTKRMHDLIEGVLRYSRIARSREEVKDVNLGELVPDVVELLAPPPHVQVKIHDPLPIIRCEPTKMQQVFQNLISNAVKFIDKPQGLVEIGCARENGHWRFYVRDNGPGIEERHFEKIFQIFQTLAPRDEYESTGIGLTVVKKIIEGHGGRIWVESKLGAGTTFHFTVPLETVT